MKTNPNEVKWDCKTPIDPSQVKWDSEQSAQLPAIQSEALKREEVSAPHIVSGERQGTGWIIAVIIVVVLAIALAAGVYFRFF
jgi:hypothetical protein